MIKNKPHSNDNVLIETTGTFGEASQVFTDAWYNYFDSLDREVNITINQTINNSVGGSIASSTSSISWQVADLESKVDSIAGNSRMSSLESTVDELRAQISELRALRDIDQDSTQVQHPVYGGFHEDPPQVDPTPRAHSHSKSDLIDFSDADYATAAQGALVATAVQLVSVPASASSPGSVGQIAIESGFLYAAVATDTWERAVMATWP